MDTEALDIQLKEGEGLTIEFKEHFSAKLDKDFVAFANTCGGHILLGVDDQGNVIGETLTNELKAKINNLARNCEPALCLNKIEQVGRVVAITIDESNHKPHGCSTGYYRRLDATTQKMNQQELKFLFDHAGQTTRFEKQPNHDISWDAISSEKIHRFLSEASINMDNIAPKKLLNSLRLAQGNEINHAGVLFFAQKPTDLLLQCEMILVAFKGVKGIHIYDRVNVQDDLITQFHEAMMFLRKHLNVRSEIKGINRRDIIGRQLSFPVSDNYDCRF